MEISIIMPVYNKIAYLPSILKQISCQSFKDFDCIVIDDGSTDGSGEVCDSFAETDSRFIVRHIKNNGVSHARNIGLDIAQGRYITFIDADDKIHHEYLENLYTKLVSSEADMIIGSSLKFWDDKRPGEPISVPFKGTVSVKQAFRDFANHQYKNGIYGYCWGKMIKRCFVQGVRFNESIVLAEDLEFYSSVYPKINSIYFDENAYYYYRQEAENSSMQKADSDIDYYAQIVIQNKLYTMLCETDCMNESNETLVTNRIYDYVFFTLYHRKDELPHICNMIRSLELPPLPSLSSRTQKQKIILKCFVKKKDRILKLILSLIHTFKKSQR